MATEQERELAPPARAVRPSSMPTEIVDPTATCREPARSAWRDAHPDGVAGGQRRLRSRRRDPNHSAANSSAAADRQRDGDHRRRAQDALPATSAASTPAMTTGMVPMTMSRRDGPGRCRPTAREARRQPWPSRRPEIDNDGEQRAERAAPRRRRARRRPRRRSSRRRRAPG